jgi:hypothetical protein
MRHGGDLLKFSGHAFALRFEGSGEEVIAKGGYGEGSIVWMAHGSNLTVRAEAIEMQRRV